MDGRQSVLFCRVLILSHLHILVPEFVDEDGDGVEGVVGAALGGRGHHGQREAEDVEERI